MNNTTFTASESLFKAINSVAGSNKTGVYIDTKIGDVSASVCKIVNSAGTLECTDLRYLI